MNISLFNRRYWLRRFGEQREVKGYLTAGHTDCVISIHAHPMGTDTLQALPEGERSVKRIEGHGPYKLNTAETGSNKKADLLLYDGNWYECVVCMSYKQTILSHYNYQFVQVPLDGSRRDDIANTPTGDPEKERVVETL